MKNSLLVMVALLGLSVAAAPNWKSAVSGNWSDTTKWDPARVPTADDSPTYSLKGEVTITNDTGAGITVVALGMSGGNHCWLTLDMQGKTFTSTATGNANAAFPSCTYPEYSYREMIWPESTLIFKNGTFVFNAGILMGGNGQKAHAGIVIQDATVKFRPKSWNNSSRVYVSDGGTWEPTADINMPGSGSGLFRGYAFTSVSGACSRVAASARSFSVTAEESGIYALDGGLFEAGTLNAPASTGGISNKTNVFLIARGGAFAVKTKLALGVNVLGCYKPTLTVADEGGFVGVTNASGNAVLSLRDKVDATLAIEMPVGGFKDADGETRAPILADKIEITSNAVNSDGAPILSLVCMDWAVANPDVTVPLITLHTANETVLAALKDNVTFVDVPSSFIAAGMAPTLAVSDDGCTLSMTAPHTVSTDPTPPDFSVTTAADGGEKGGRVVTVNVGSYGYLSTRATRIACEWGTAPDYSDAVTTELAADVATPTPVALVYSLSGCGERVTYYCKLIMENDQGLSKTVEFSFTDAGHKKNYKWAAAQDGEWTDLAKWTVGGDPAAMLPEGEDAIQAFPGGSYTVSIPEDRSYFSMGSGFGAGTLVSPNVYTFDLRGHTLRSTGISVQGFALIGTSAHPAARFDDRAVKVIVKDGTINALSATSWSTQNALEFRIDNATVSMKLDMCKDAYMVVTNGGRFNANVDFVVNRDAVADSWSTLRVTGPGSSFVNTYNTYLAGSDSLLLVEKGASLNSAILAIGGATGTNSGVGGLNAHCIIDDSTATMTKDLQLGYNTLDKFANGDSENPQLTIRGEHAYVTAASAGPSYAFTIYNDVGAKLEFEIPETGFRDGEGVSRAPLSVPRMWISSRAYTGKTDHGQPTLRIRLRQWAKANAKGTTQELIRLKEANAAALQALADSAEYTDLRSAKADGFQPLTVEEDGKVLLLHAPPLPGAMLLVR